jgi:hypothetical protein
MKASFKAAQPDEIEMTLTLTMPLKEWREFAATIKQDYPGWKIKGIIQDLIDAANRHFHAIPESEASE